MERVVELKEKKIGDILIIEIHGRLDALSTPDIEKKVFADINDGQYKFIFDFSFIDYISSAGMRMLLSISKKLKGLSGHLILCCIATNVMDVFKMSGFDHILELADSKEDALKKL